MRGHRRFGRLFGLSVFRVSLEAAQVSSILPGPYKMERLPLQNLSVASNKAPILPYRGRRAYRRVFCA